jgi:AraC-like DNA-binding protein
MRPTFGEYARNVREAEVGFIVTEPSRSDWAVRRREVGGSVLQFGLAGAGTIADGVMTQSDVLVFVLQSSLSSHRVFLDGARVGPNGLAVLAPGSEFVFANQVPHRWISVSVGVGRLPRRLVERFDEQIARRETWLIDAEPYRFADLARIAAAHAGGRAQGVPAGSSACRPCSEDELVDALAALVASSTPSDFGGDRQGRPHYRALVRHALSTIQAFGSLHVRDLCRASGVEERTLRRAFNDVFRMPPANYLKLRQLNQVHAALCECGARGGLVTDVLTCHGVTEFGRFAAHYRRLFGESPSQTLRRHAFDGVKYGS